MTWLIRKRAWRHKTGTSLPVSFFRVPRFIDDGDLRLRRMRISDVPLMREGLSRTGFSATARQPNRGKWRSALALWWWLRRTYILLFCIEAGGERIGFVGLCNLTPPESAEITLVLFDPRHRRRGYGTRAYHSLIRTLSQGPLVKRIIAKVSVDNGQSLSFWGKMGLREIEIRNGKKTFAQELSSRDAQGGH